MDESIFQMFFEKTARPLWSYIHSVTGDASLSDDIQQESYLRFLKAAASRSFASRDESQMKSYLYKIATNLINDHWREQKLTRMRLLENSSQTPLSKSDENRSENYSIAQVFQKLKHQERSLLWLAYVEGSEHKEIARALGLKEKSVRVLLFRARRRLAVILREIGIGPEEKG